MKTLTKILELTLPVIFVCCLWVVIVSFDHKPEDLKDSDPIISKYEDMTALEKIQSGVFETSTKYVYYDFSDSTLTFQLLFELDAFGKHYEFHDVSRKFDLKLLSDRDSLRASPARPALNAIGSVNYNQFTNF